MDKNPEHISDNDLEKIKKEFSLSNPVILLCDNPFVKTAFLHYLINTSNDKIIFLDFDLLYSGYITSKLIKGNNRVNRVFLDKENWNKKLAEVLSKISVEKYLVIIDSLNGMNNVFAEKDYARFINASIMLLASCGRKTGSKIIATGMARKRESELVLVPGGRHIIESKNSRNFFLEEKDEKILIKTENKISEKVFQINFLEN